MAKNDDEYEVERRLRSLEQAYDDLKRGLAGARTTPVEALNRRGCLQFAMKVQKFAESLEPSEQRDLVRLLAPAVNAASEAGKAPTKNRHRIPAAYLQELELRLARGTLTLREGADVVAATPATIATIGTITITTTIASHPIIGCNGGDDEPPI